MNLKSMHLFTPFNLECSIRRMKAFQGTAGGPVQPGRIKGLAVLPEIRPLLLVGMLGLDPVFGMH